MGISDNNAMPVLLFVVSYSIFITTIFGLTTYDLATETYEVTSNWSLNNVVTSIAMLGVWSALLFLPAIVGLGYVALALAVPAWV